MNGGCGFTLLELILVLIVISTVLAISSPSLRGFLASRQTADTARAVLSLTKLARTTAMSQGRPCRLNIDTRAGALWLTMQKAQTYVTLESDLGRKYQLPEGSTVSVDCETFNPDSEYLVFYPSGRGDTATIEIRGKRGDSFLVASPSATESFRVISPAEASRT